MSARILALDRHSPRRQLRVHARSSAPVPNLAFVTSATVTGNIGVAGADAMCAQAANNAGLAGTFVAWISTSGVNAIDRITGARGWVRTDGASVMDTIDPAFDGAMFAPIDHDENGA